MEQPMEFAECTSIESLVAYLIDKGQLSDREADYAVLAVIYEKSAYDIADIFGESEAEVRRSLARIRMILKALGRNATPLPPSQVN
jgi:DNA-binding CsgD family transcriptional regulator